MSTDSSGEVGTISEGGEAGRRALSRKQVLRPVAAAGAALAVPALRPAKALADSTPRGTVYDRLVIQYDAGNAACNLSLVANSSSRGPAVAFGLWGVPGDTLQLPWRIGTDRAGLYFSHVDFSVQPNVGKDYWYVTGERYPKTGIGGDNPKGHLHVVPPTLALLTSVGQPMRTALVLNMPPDYTGQPTLQLQFGGGTRSQFWQDGSLILGGAIRPSELLDVRGTAVVQQLKFATGAYRDWQTNLGPALYSTDAGGAGYPFQDRGHLILQPRTAAPGQYDVILATRQASASAPSPTLTATAAGSVGIGAAPDYANGQGVLALQNAVAAPAADPAGGGILYAMDGALCWRGPSGSVTVLAPA
jgi:hypothetical protein